MFKIGQGYDVHQLKSDLPLIIGGVNIPHSKGIVAHSDGDILSHAIIDALLGACNLGDIGTLFPNESKWENANGLDMLKTVKQLIDKNDKRFNIVNIDTTVILQKPKLQPYINLMITNIAETLSIKKDLISIKATTTDKLGFIGSEDGVGCLSICLLKEEFK
tara:strand:- start:289 stop:774 length:486 start_codon:yes stop_codon:yes gene_type:complete